MIKEVFIQPQEAGPVMTECADFIAKFVYLQEEIFKFQSKYKEIFNEGNSTNFMERELDEKIEGCIEQLSRVQLLIVEHFTYKKLGING